MSPRNHGIAFPQPQQRVIDPANPRGAIDDGIEHRLHVRRRAADDAEHLGGCSLMLQSLAQLCVALLEFFEQPHVLDSDHCLVGKGLKKRNLLVCKRANFRSADNNSSDGDVLAEQWRSKYSPCPSLHSLASGVRRKFGELFL